MQFADVMGGKVVLPHAEILLCTNRPYWNAGCSSICCRFFCSIGQFPCNGKVRGMGMVALGVMRMMMVDEDSVRSPIDRNGQESGFKARTGLK